MSTDDLVQLKERLKGFPVEPFNKDTNVYPYYVTFVKGDLKVNYFSCDHIHVDRSKFQSLLILMHIVAFGKIRHFLLRS